MSRPGGPYDSHADQPPAGWPHHEQYHWLYPEDWLLEDFYERYPLVSVIDGAGATRMLGEESAPVDTWPPHTPSPPPETQGLAAAQLRHDVSGPVTHDRAA